MPNLTEPEKAYIAGIVDGEGCVHVSKCFNKKDNSNCYILKLTIASVDFILAEWFMEKVGARVYPKKPTGNSKRIIYHICLQNEKAMNVLKAIKEYLTIKKKRVDFVIDQYPGKDVMNKNQRDFVHSLLSRFNQREVIEDSLLIPSSFRAESEN